MTATTEAGVVAELTEAAHQKPHTVSIEHGGVAATVLLVPKAGGGYDQHCVGKLLDPYRLAPQRRSGQANLSDLASFIAHVNRFKDADSVIFADRIPASPSLLCVLDYHRATADGAPRFGAHRASYKFPLSDQWTAWKGMNEKGMDQASFASWIEDRLHDVASPDIAGPVALSFTDLLSCGFASPSKLLELSRGLTVHVGRKVTNATSLATGEATMSFAEEHGDSTGKPLKLPTAFLLALPVFRNGAPYQIPARLRYRVKDGAVTWSFSLARMDETFDHAVNEACLQAASDTALPVFQGTPEA